MLKTDVHPPLFVQLPGINVTLQLCLRGRLEQFFSNCKHFFPLVRTLHLTFKATVDTKEPKLFRNLCRQEASKSKLCLIGTERVNALHQTINVQFPYNLCVI